MKLAELQRYFAKAATSGRGPLPELDLVFLGSERLSASERLAIYNRSYFYRLLDALACVFEQTKRALGERDFERLGLEYVAQHPSQHPAVERIGRAFPAYLRLAAAPPMVVDLASLEWARLCTLVAPNPLHVAGVRDMDPSRAAWARLRFVPALQWLELDARALHAFRDEGAASPDADAATSAAARCGVAVWRNGHSIQHRRLELAEWRALLSATSGATLNHVCAAFDTGSAEEDVQRAFQALSRWFAQKWLASVDYDQAPAASE